MVFLLVILGVSIFSYFLCMAGFVLDAMLCRSLRGRRGLHRDEAVPEADSALGAQQELP